MLAISMAFLPRAISSTRDSYLNKNIFHSDQLNNRSQLRWIGIEIRSSSAYTAMTCKRFQQMYSCALVS